MEMFPKMAERVLDLLLQGLPVWQVRRNFLDSDLQQDLFTDQVDFVIEEVQTFFGL